MLSDILDVVLKYGGFVFSLVAGVGLLGWQIGAAIQMGEKSMIIFIITFPLMVFCIITGVCAWDEIHKE